MCMGPMKKAQKILPVASALMVIWVSALAAGQKEGTVMVASFSTSVEDQDSNVKRNIAMACARLDNTVIKSGSIFSFNDTVGEGSAKNGFADGRVLYRDRVAYEPGGGICQVSSTLFNAFLLAGMDIVVRHRHFQPVTYVPLGLDATIKYGKKDLRMRNRYRGGLVIRASMNEKSLVVKIMAEEKLPFLYDLFTEEEEIPVPFADDDQEKIRNGISVHVYRKKYSGNKLIETFLLYKDFYPPVKFK